MLLLECLALFNISGSVAILGRVVDSWLRGLRLLVGVQVVNSANTTHVTLRVANRITLRVLKRYNLGLQMQRWWKDAIAMELEVAECIAPDLPLRQRGC